MGFFARLFRLKPVAPAVSRPATAQRSREAERPRQHVPAAEARPPLEERAWEEFFPSSALQAESYSYLCACGARFESGCGPVTKCPRCRNRIRCRSI